MPSPGSDPSSALEDEALLRAAARAVGPILLGGFKSPSLKVWSKGAAGPVSEIDLAANAALEAQLRPARPGYGWLSEEGPDDPTRLSKQRVFLLDPLDGTASFLNGSPDFCVAVAVVEDGAPIAAAIYAPVEDKIYSAARGAGARGPEGGPLTVSAVAAIADCRMMGPKGLFSHRAWSPSWPTMRLVQRGALAYRLAGVAAAEADACISLGFKSEWDIAAGALLIQEAGGLISDPWGAALRFNQADPRFPGVVAAGPHLHALLIERTHKTPHPSTFGTQ